MCSRTRATRPPVAHALGRMAPVYSPPRPRASSCAVVLVAFALVGLLLGLIVTQPRAGAAVLVPVLGAALVIAARTHRLHRLAARWLALAFAIGFDLGALVLPRLL